MEKDVPFTSNNAMSSETAQEKSDRWVTAVLDLIKLTNQGAIQWKRSTDPALKDEEYEADLGGNREAKLEKLPFWMWMEQDLRTYPRWHPLYQSSSEPSVKTRKFPYLRIYQGHELAVSFPDIAPLAALTNAVEDRVATDEHGVLADIHALAENASVH